jgi:hypothetical protein
MGTQTDFWLLLHNLAEATREEGRESAARQAHLEESFGAMPEATRREISRDFRLVLAELSNFESAWLRLSLTRSSPRQSCPTAISGIGDSH